MAFITVYVTFPDRATADRICRQVLEAKLVAGCNIFAIESAYWWQGSLNQHDEWAAILQTRSDLWPTLQAEIRHAHPYEVPCMIKTSVEANPDYEAWVWDQTLDT